MCYSVYEGISGPTKHLHSGRSLHVAIHFIIIVFCICTNGSTPILNVCFQFFVAFTFVIFITRKWNLRFNHVIYNMHNLLYIPLNNVCKFVCICNTYGQTVRLVPPCWKIDSFQIIKNCLPKEITYKYNINFYHRLLTRTIVGKSVRVGHSSQLFYRVHQTIFLASFAWGKLSNPMTLSLLFYVCPTERPGH